MNGEPTTFHLSTAHSFYRPSLIHAALYGVSTIHTPFWPLTDRGVVIPQEHLPSFLLQNSQHFAFQRHKRKRWEGRWS